ncbi:sulfotransferase family 2 domain-containing protein [Acidithiobacillus thiooxidans]|uniref:Sulfotransferase family protein n=1 Tax=Acidithiobacillus thiooxidans ATCC 19377 TaxID=637390 RepID=A0A543PZC5_ACITH|nr:sulfotransferase family 2 domain-containing protein [Acidithiobacillus thiooxidans]MDX5936498.1 sulfotransferase family 2 domain-containing protein [Acidithiobacillus thiooxidans]TQN49401.1 hypothetical protein DLNHIDIE_03253 [Acidithiobacillus thiooxidans ATCC 19377]
MNLKPNHFRWDLARNTFYLPDFKLLYLATPKAACTAWKWWVTELAGISREQIVESSVNSRESVEDLLIHDGIGRCKPEVQSFDLEQMQKHYADPDLFRFALVRNPYTRVFSAWASKVLLSEPGQRHHGEWLTIPRTIQELAQGFEDFLGEVEAGEYPDAWINSHWVPQSVWLDLPGVPFTRIYAIERMEQALSEIGERVRLQGSRPPDLRRYNETILPWQPRFLTQQARQRIIRLYQNDFSRFSYDPEQIPGRNDLSDEAVQGLLTAIPHLQERQRRIESLYQATTKLDAEKVQWMGLAETRRLQREQERVQQQQSIAAYKQLAENAERKVALMEASRSWRLTRSLRNLTAVLRSMRGDG